MKLTLPENSLFANLLRARLDAAIDALRAMTWEEFARALEQGYRREGYSVKRLQGAGGSGVRVRAGGRDDPERRGVCE